MSHQENVFDFPDWFLQSLVEVVNHTDAEIGITLTVGGFLISGDLVGGSKYFEAFGTGFAGAIKDLDAAANIYASISSLSKIYTEKKEASDEVTQPRFIHLRNAKIFHNSGPTIPTHQGVWWRGRLSEIDGFTLGSLGLSA